jgi:tetratricopeptide (TPR) repeat protein
VRRFEEAIACYQQSLAAKREAADLYGEGRTLDNLGNAYHQMEQPGRATASWRKAAAAMRDAGEHEQAARLDHEAANAQAGQRS